MAHCRRSHQRVHADAQAHAARDHAVETSASLTCEAGAGALSELVPHTCCYCALRCVGLALVPKMTAAPESARSVTAFLVRQVAVPRGSLLSEATADVVVGRMRQLDFLADEEGNWGFHRQKKHHTMKAIGRSVSNMPTIDTANNRQV